MATVISDLPELLALAALAAVPASKVAAAFNDPEHFFDHISLEELARVQAACERLGALQAVLVETLDVAATAVRQRQAEAVNAD